MSLHVIYHLPSYEGTRHAKRCSRCAGTGVNPAITKASEELPPEQEPWKCRGCDGTGIEVLDK